MNTFQKLYVTSLSQYVRPYFKQELSTLKKIVDNTSTLDRAYQGLRIIHLIYYIVVELYEKEYPFVAKRLRQDVPLLNELEIWRGKLFKYIRQNQVDGPFKVGGNTLLKYGGKNYYISYHQELFNISDKHLVDYPPVLGSRLKTEKEKLLKRKINLPLTLHVSFKPESNLLEINNKLHQYLETLSTSNEKELKVFRNAAKKEFLIKNIKDYSTNFDFVFQNINSKSKPFGYKKCYKLCELRADSLGGKGKLRKYNKKFFEHFSSEYEKRLRFLTLASLFVKNVHKNKKNVWFLRDQIEPYLLKKSFDQLIGREKQDDRFIFVSRNTTSLKHGDHYSYSAINSWYYRAANQTKSGNYKDFINNFYKLYKADSKSHTFFKTVSSNIIEHLLAEGVLDKKKKRQSLDFIDTGFQGTFNIFIEALLKEWMKEENRIVKVDHYLMGIWPWLASILDKKHLTTYFPIVLIVEFFDGIHELVQFDRFEKEAPLFKQADPRHQLPTFLDLLLVHDVAIAVYNLYWDKKTKDFSKNFSL